MTNENISLDEFTLVEVPSNLIDEVSWTTARAYQESPAYKWVFDDDKETRLYEMKVLFAGYLGMLQGSDEHVTRCLLKEEVNEHNETIQTVVCSFLLLNTKHPLSLWSKIRNGLLKLPFIYGIPRLLNLLKLGKDLDEEILEVMGDRDFVKLERMIVNPRFQGQGVGSKCLSSALNEERFKGLPVVLSTQEERNVRFYKKLGFKVAKAKDYMFEGKKVFNNWTMLRDPDAATNRSD